MYLHDLLKLVFDLRLARQLGRPECCATDWRPVDLAEWVERLWLVVMVVQSVRAFPTANRFQ